MKTSTNNVKLPIKEGIDPVIAFCPIVNEFSFVNELIVLGIVPVREQCWRLKVSSDVMLPIKEGIEPVIELYPISRNTNFVKALKVSGIGPINLLPDRLN